MNTVKNTACICSSYIACIDDIESLITQAQKHLWIVGSQTFNSI